MTFVKLTNLDDSPIFVNVAHIVGFQLAIGATEVTTSTENILRVKQSVLEIAMEIDTLQEG